MISALAGIPRLEGSRSICDLSQWSSISTNLRFNRAFHDFVSEGVQGFFLRGEALVLRSCHTEDQGSDLQPVRVNGFQ